MKPFIVFSKCQIRPLNPTHRPQNSHSTQYYLILIFQIRPPNAQIRGPKKAEWNGWTSTQNRPPKSAIRPPIFHSFRTTISSQFQNFSTLTSNWWLCHFNHQPPIFFTFSLHPTTPSRSTSLHQTLFNHGTSPASLKITLHPITLVF